MKYPLHTVLVAVLAGAALNAHALCMNPDGSLDDDSISKGTIAVDMLPACKDQKAKATDVTPEVAATKKQGPSAEMAKPVAKNVSGEADCQTPDGKSRAGYNGAAEMLPVCAW